MTEETIFATALEKSEPAERAAYLAEACGADTALRQRVEGLLAAHDMAGEFLEKPAVQPHDPAAASTQTFGEVADPETDVTHTHGGSHEATPTDEVLAFLSPSTRAGSLGRLGHYEILEVLGRGGFGIVLRALDDKLQRVVAVKVLAPQMAATSPARKRFLREARSSGQVRHENVVQVHAVEEQPLPYLVMEYIPGETLQQLLDRNGPLEVAEVLRLGVQIASGLAAAHEAGLIHRDVKPANVLLESGVERRAKLTDFGLARAADDASISQSGIVAGTPMYMAPEQARGDSLDHRADLFSLGSVLYVMCSGRPPFRANSTLAVLKRVAEDEPRPIREIIPEIPEWFCRVVEKLHAKDPAERFQSAREVADVLAECEQQLKAHGALRDFARIPEAKPAPSRGRRRWSVAAAIFVALCSASAYGLSQLGRSRDVVQQPDAERGVLSLKLNDPAIEFRIDGGGATLTAVTNFQTPLEPGLHHLWVKLANRKFTTAKFPIASGERAELAVTITPDRAEARLGENALEVTADALPSLGGDLAAFQGTWTARLPQLFEAVEMRFDRNNYEFKVPGKPNESFFGTFEVLTDTREILLRVPDQIVPIRCAYRLESDRLRLDFAGLFGDPGDALRIAERSSSSNNLKQFGLAMHNYGALHNGLPQSGTRKDGKPLLSWRVALLPFLEQDDLYREFKQNEPWDSPHNKALIPKMPNIYAAPGIKPAAPGLTHYRAFSGPRGTGLDSGSRIRSQVFRVRRWYRPYLPRRGGRGTGGLDAAGRPALFDDGTAAETRSLGSRNQCPIR